MGNAEGGTHSLLRGCRKGARRGPSPGVTERQSSTGLRAVRRVLRSSATSAAAVFKSSERLLRLRVAAMLRTLWAVTWMTVLTSCRKEREAWIQQTVN